MTAILLPNGKQQYFTTAGLPAVGYKVATFDAGTSNPRITWQDALKVAQNTNPVILDGRGEASIFWEGAYKVQLQDSTGAVIWTQDNLQSQQNSFSVSLLPAVTNTVDLGSVALSWRNLYLGANNTPALDTGTGNIGYYARTAAEIAAAVVPVNFSYLPGHVYRYGTNTTPGTTDMTAPINNALASNKRVYAPADTYFCSASLNLASGQTFYGDGAATILQWSNASLNNIVGSGITNTVVRDLKINVTGSGSVVTTGGVLLQSNSTYCKVLRVEIAGVNWAGVWILGSSNNTVRDCYFHNFTGTQANTSDVIVTNDSGGVNLCDYNIVDGNECFGGCRFAVTFQQFYSVGGGITPRYNIASNNRIGQHSEYGILFYNVLSFTDTFNQALGNHIENIQGTPNTSSGTGIYVAGQGGTVIANNVVKNCCAVTSAASLTPAGIGLNGSGGTNQSPFTITGNHIENMVGFRGIEVASFNYGGVISGNTISFNNFGPDFGIYVHNCSNVAVTGNNINILAALGTTRGIYVDATTASMSGIAITGNTINGCSFRGIAMDTSGGFFITNFVINGNSVQIGSSTCIGIGLANVQIGAVSNNNVSCPTLAAFNMGTSVTVRITGNNFFSAGTTSVATSGVCTGSYFDKSNSWNALMNNAATGLIAEQLANAAPATGTWAIGDRTEQSVPVVANPKGWRCTVAGTPGTWVSEGNL